MKALSRHASANARRARRRGLRRGAPLLGADGRDGRQSPARLGDDRPKARGAARPRDGERSRVAPQAIVDATDRQARRAARARLDPRHDGQAVRRADPARHASARGRGFRRTAVDAVDALHSDARRLGGAARPAARLSPARRRSICADLDPRRWSSNISPISTRRGRCKLEIAADYLVMAAWLAYLKSCAAAAARSRGGPEPRRDSRCGCSCGSSGSTRCARRARGCWPRPDRPRCVSCAARPRGCGSIAQGAVAGATFRPVRRLWRGPCAHPAGDARRPRPRR